jgi:hypothetical protein
MAEPDDGYEAYYAGKLWSLLPEIYRALDATSPPDPSVLTPPAGPLQEIVNRIGAQAATLRRSIDRMWEDQSIESCDDWVIPYIGAQLATNLVSGQDPRAQRLDVFKTIYYRQRKGTVPLLEELAWEIAGWDARVVEMWRRIGRARHGLDPGFGPPAGVATWDADAGKPSSPLVASGLIGANTGTPIGGFADLRNVYGASRTSTAFDEFSRTADIRTSGRYNIPIIGVFLWRLQSVMVQGVTPVAAAGGDNQFTFDPTGRDVPLFASPVRAFDADWTPRPEYQLPGPIDDGLLKFALPKLYASTDPTGQTLLANSIGLFDGPPGAATLVPLRQISAGPPVAGRYVIDPSRGRVTVPAGSQPPLVSYCYGFSSSIGAGGYDRRVPGRGGTPMPPATTTVTGGGGGLTGLSGGVVEIADSLTYDSAPNAVIGGAAGPNSLILRARNQQRPLVRLPLSTPGPAQWSFTGTAAGGRGNVLVLDGLFVSGGDIVLEGVFDEVRLSACTLDPGAPNGGKPLLAADGRPLIPTHLRINGTVRRLAIDRCIVGPITTRGGGSLERTRITDSILLTGDPSDAIEIAGGATTIRGSTVLGEARFHQLEASDSLFSGVVMVADNQAGCIRFSGWIRGSVLPSQYKSIELDPDQVLFVSTTFGDPRFAQLLPTVPTSVGAGAEDGSELGAFSRDKNPIRQHALLLKYQEFTPVGVTPVIIHAT